MNAVSLPRLATVALACLLLTACGSQGQKDAGNTASALDDAADAVRVQGENVADRIEDRSDRMSNQIDAIADNATDAMKEKAKSVREGAEKTADKIEERADDIVKAAKGK